MLSGVIKRGFGISGRYEELAINLSQLLFLFPYGGSEFTMSIYGEIAGYQEMSYAIGIALILGLVLYAICYVNFNQKTDRLVKLGKISSLISILAIWMTTVYFPWSRLEQLGGRVVSYFTWNTQFPWRFLGVATVMLVFTLLVATDWIKRNGSQTIYYIVIAFFIMLTLISGNYLVTDYMMRAPIQYLVDEEDVPSCSIGTEEYLPPGAKIPQNEVWYNEHNIKVYTSERAGETYWLECTNLTNEEQYIQIPVIYYKYYCASDLETGDALMIKSGEEGRIKIVLPERYHGKIAIKFVSPWHWRASELVSLIVWLGVLYMKFTASKLREKESYFKGCF